MDTLGDWILTKDTTLVGYFSGVDLVEGNIVVCTSVNGDMVELEYSPFKAGWFYNNLSDIAEKID